MRRFVPMLVAVLVLGACGTPAPAASVPAPVGSGRPAPTAATASAAAGSSSAPTALAAFLSTPLTDVRSGERFTLADYKGKVTIVEGMAVW